MVVASVHDGRGCRPRGLRAAAGQCRPRAGTGRGPLPDRYGVQLNRARFCRHQPKTAARQRQRVWLRTGAADQVSFLQCLDPDRTCPIEDRMNAAQPCSVSARSLLITARQDNSPADLFRALRKGTSRRVLRRLEVVLAGPDIDETLFWEQARLVGPLKVALTVPTAPDDGALPISRMLADGRDWIGTIALTGDGLDERAQENRVRTIDVSSRDTGYRAQPGDADRRHVPTGSRGRSWQQTVTGRRLRLSRAKPEPGRCGIRPLIQGDDPER